MDNFNLQDYIASGKLHTNSKTLTEAKKQGYDDREDESLGARKGAEKGKKQSMKDRRDDSYGKFGKRDAEKKGKNKINKEGLEEEFVGTDINANSLLNILAEYLPTNHYHQDKTLSYDEALEMVTEFVKFTGMDSTGEDFLMHIADTEGPIEEGYKDGMKDEKADLQKEDARTDAEEEGYEDGFKDAKTDMKDALSKMKVSELKAKIKETILAELSLSEAEDDFINPGNTKDDQSKKDDYDYDSRPSHMKEAEEVDVDIDVEDEVEVDAEADDIEIERKGVKAKVEVGLTPEEEIVQDSLKAAMDAANELGNQKLADQIGNTITFFTREFVVGQNTD